MESTNNTIDAIREARIQKLTDLIDNGINPYPYSYDRNTSANDLQKKYENLAPREETDDNYSVAGRVMAIFSGLFYVSRVVHAEVEPSFWWYNFCGVLWGMSVVIPGMTSSSIMMALGLYQPMLEGLAALDFIVLSASLPGMFLTIALLARFMNWFFRQHYAIAYHGILGFVLASTLVIIPTSYTGPGEIALSVLCCGAGFLLAFCLARLEEKNAC